MKKLDMKKFLENRKQYANEIFDLTWHEGKGWGFQAGVLKGDFAH